jgi:ABC-type antimicrobial peptide transport system permease subunit
MRRRRSRAYLTFAVAGIRQRWWEAAVQACVALLTMAVVGAGLLTASSVPASYAATKQQLNGPDLWVATMSTAAPALYAATSQLSEVRALTPIYMVQSGVIRVGGKELPAAISPLPDTPPHVGSLTVATGAWPTANAKAALLERGAAESIGAAPGSELTVVGGGGSLSMQVSGVVRDISRASYPLSTPAVVYVSASAWQALGGDSAARSALFGAQVHDLSRLRATALAIRDLVPAGVPIAINDGGLVVEGLQPIVLALEGFLVLFGLFALVAGIFFVVGTTRADLIRQARTLGILRATGWSLRQVRWLLMLQRGASVVLGVVLGAIAAVALAGWMTSQVVQLMGLSPTLDAAPVVLAGVGGLIVLAALAAVRLATRGFGRTSPATMLAAGYRQPPSRLAGSLEVGRGGLGPRLGAALLLGRPGRTSTAVAVLLLGLVTVIFTVITEATLANFGSDPSTWGYAYDWRVDYVRALAPADVQRALDNTAGIQASTAIYDLNATLDGNRTDARFLTPNQDLLQFHLLAGKPIRSDSEVLIGAGLAASTGLTPGRSVLLQIGTDQAMVQVAGVYRELDNLGQVVVGRDSLLLRLRPQAIPSYFVARLQPVADAAGVRSRLEQGVGGQVVISPVRDLIAVPLGNVFQAVLLILGFGLAAVAGMVMFAMTMILADEHAFVIGILKAIGARRRQLAASLAWAAGLLMLPAIVLAVPAGILLTAALLSVLSQVIGGVDAVVPAGGLALAIPLALLAPIVGFAIPARAALAASPLEAIEMER